jgi:predicted TIM-barrel fold metal-dependent hydrolase
MMSRDSLHAPVREDWLALRREEILEPGRPIVDPHHHLWDRPGARYLFPELLADMNAGHKVLATVYVQCRSMYRASGPEELRPVGEVEFVNGIAAQAASGIYGERHACAGIVGFADLTLGERVAPVLEALERAGGGRLRGVRQPVVWHADGRVRSSPAQPPPGLMADARFRAGVAELAGHGLSLDVWAYHTQLDEILDLARACPRTVLVLDHLGGPVGVSPYADKRDEVRTVWKEGLARLAELPNVRLKLGGLGMRVGGFTFHERELPPSSAERERCNGTVHGGVVDGDAAVGEHALEVAVADRELQVPAHRPQDDLGREAEAAERPGVGHGRGSRRKG